MFYKSACFCVTNDYRFLISLCSFRDTAFYLKMGFDKISKLKKVGTLINSFEGI